MESQETNAFKSDEARIDEDELIDVDTIIETLANNDQVSCKSQQRDEATVTKAEKTNILRELFEKSKSGFLSRFGTYLTPGQAEFFEQFKVDPNDGYEIDYHLRNIAEHFSKRKRHTHLRNRRFAAIKRLEKDQYFSETEMMKRNPLLYEQLIGQYLSEKEKRVRDRAGELPRTFVGILMDGIEKKNAEEKRKKQEEAEDAAMENEEGSEDEADSTGKSSPAPSENLDTLWGEYTSESKPHTSRKNISLQRTTNGLISAKERKLLREEFVSAMYESFLDGDDEEFDYTTVDNNDEYDDIEILANDEEEKYFDSEEPEDMVMVDQPNEQNESSEDELDIYMSALNQHPAVCKLSEEIKKL